MSSRSRNLRSLSEDRKNLWCRYPSLHEVVVRASCLQDMLSKTQAGSPRHNAKRRLSLGFPTNSAMIAEGSQLSTNEVNGDEE